MLGNALVRIYNRSQDQALRAAKQANDTIFVGIREGQSEITMVVGPYSGMPEETVEVSRNRLSPRC
jgi:hypothetical protein